MIFIGGIVVDALVGIAAGSVNGDLVLSVFHFAAAAWLVNGSENMEKLADAFRFRTAGNGIRPHESCSYKAGLGGEVTGKPQCSHASAVRLQRQLVRKVVLRLLGREVQKVVEAEHLLRKRRIVGQDTGGIVIDLNSRGSGFYCNGLVLVTMSQCSCAAGIFS